MTDLSQLEAYTIIEKQQLEEVKGVGYVLSHNKTKARVCVIINDDDNKVFNIGFRTPPHDRKGIPHIMEHSVLCGSKKFPVKDPFVELCKGSLNTFLNAMTYSDKTLYPVASLNKKDFHNLMHVYLDGVFYPNIFDKKEIMMQEGWHYEYDEEEQCLKYNGVVFNEMKGVYSSAEEILYRLIAQSLLPDTCYGFESGGDPECIPDLSYEEFLDFHRQYYHPSNSYIYLYGDMDAAYELDFIDKEYLSKYDYLEIDSRITDQKEFEKPQYISSEYSLADAEEEKNNTYLSYNVCIGKSVDKKLACAINVLDHALLGSAGAPLKTALIDAGIGKDIFSSYDDGINQPTFSIIAQNANKEDEEKFIKIIDDTLTDICKNKINRKSLLASISYFEFKHKEGNYGRFPKGLMLGLNAFDSWLYDDTKALDSFTLNYIFDELKKDIDTGYFEELILKYFINNNHKAYISLIPKKGLNEIKKQEEQQRLDEYEKTLSKEELEEIKQAADKLKKYQESDDAEEDLKKIPMLTIADIEKKARTINNQFSEIEYVKVVSHDIFTNGISYINLNFDITDIDNSMYPYVSLLTEIFKYVDTKNYSYNELAHEINLTTGGIGFNTSIISGKEYGTYMFHFLVNLKLLDENINDGMKLVDEILFTSKINDKKRLKEIIAETVTNLKNGLVSSGHTTASERAVSYISPIGAVKELTEGVDYYIFLDDLYQNFDEKADDLIDNLQTVLSEMLTRDGLIISYTSDKDPKTMLGESVSALSKKLSTRSKFDKNMDAGLSIKNEGFMTASQVQYVATAGNFREKGLEYTGALSVLRVIFSYDYLWINVRVKGGAYGSMCSFARSGNSFLTSYRDPNLMETYEIYKNAPEYVRNFDADERDMTKYIIGAIGNIDKPLTPSAQGSFSFISYLIGVDDEMLQRERDEVLTCDVDTIRNLAPYVEAISESGIICAIGGESKIEANKDSFKKIVNVF